MISGALGVAFGPEPVGANRLRLVELPDAATLAAIRAGAAVSVRGREADDAVLVVGDQTFRLRELSTSNSFLLLDAASGAVRETTGGVLEATPVRGLTGRLVQLLRQCPYDGPAAPEPPAAAALAAASLPGIVQASDRELAAALAQHRALLVDGRYRVLGAAYVCRFFELFFPTALLEDWPYAASALSRRTVLAHFATEHADEFAPPVLEHLLGLFEEPACPGADASTDTGTNATADADSCTLSETRVCRFFGDQLLRAKAHWELPELLRAWKRLVGEFTPTRAMLRGLALATEHAAGPEHCRLVHLAADELPETAAERFQLLFQTRPRWAYDDLLPYIEGLADSTPRLQALLLQHARLSTDPRTGGKTVTPLVPL